MGYPALMSHSPPPAPFGVSNGESSSPASPYSSFNPAAGFQLSPIKGIELAAARIPGAVSLAQGIPSFDTPSVVKEFVRERLLSGACDRYSLTIGLSELREEIALALEKEGLRYDPDHEILATAGSIEGITAAVLSCTQPGDEVILPSPSYVSYQGAVAIARCSARFVALDEDHNFDFQVEEIERALTKKSKAILYASPNNPTGTLFSEAKTRALMQVAERNDLTVIIDEVYKDFYYTDDRHFTPAIMPEARERVIRVCSFSKAFAMTGWRIGFLHTGAERMRDIVKYHDAMVTCAPVVSQYAAIAALRFGEPYLQEFREEFRRRRAYTIDMLDSLSHVLDYQLPRAGYFVFPRLKDTVPLARDSFRLAYDILERARVALVPGVAFGPSGEGHLRISFGREQSDIKEGLHRFAEYLHTVRNPYPSRNEARQTHANSESSASLAATAAHQISALSSHPDHAVPGFFRRTAQRALRLAARFYLRRTRPLVIGIAGVQGKTVAKRTITELLTRERIVRSTILSYNTEIGFPLSVLDLPAPRTWQEKLMLPLRASLRAVSLARCEILVLEYGVAKAGDASLLLSIARPDFLVLTDLAVADPGMDLDQIAAELRRLISAVKTHLLFAADDPRLRSLIDKDQPAHALSPDSIAADSVRCAGTTYACRREAIGRSSRLAIAAAVTLGEMIGLQRTTVQEFLNSQG